MAQGQNLYTQDKDPTTGLTKNQRAVLEGLQRGNTQVEIASLLGISRQRVNQIVSDLKSKGYKIP